MCVLFNIGTITLPRLTRPQACPWTCGDGTISLPRQSLAKGQGDNGPNSLPGVTRFPTLGQFREKPNERPVKICDLLNKPKNTPVRIPHPLTRPNSGLIFGKSGRGRGRLGPPPKYSHVGHVQGNSGLALGKYILWNG